MQYASYIVTRHVVEKLRMQVEDPARLTVIVITIYDNGLAFLDFCRSFAAALDLLAAQDKHIVPFRFFAEDKVFDKKANSTLHKGHVDNRHGKVY